MGELAALRLALDLVHVPSRVRQARAEPLPDGILLLLRIAAGEEASVAHAAASVGRTRQGVSLAVAFFIEQILLDPDADSYRVLGSQPQATTSDLRRNMALLLRWLHPDIDQKGHRSMFATRVTLAWDNLKTPERRANYDQTMHASRASRSRRSMSGQRRAAWKRDAVAIGPAHRAPPGPWRDGRALDVSRPRRRGLLRRALALLFRGMRS